MTNNPDFCIIMDMDVNSFIKEIIDNAENSPSSPERDPRFDNPLNVVKDDAVVLDADDSVEETPTEDALELVEVSPETLPAEVVDNKEELDDIVAETPENLQEIPPSAEDESIRLVEIDESEYEAVTLPLVNDEYPVADATPEDVIGEAVDPVETVIEEAEDVPVELKEESVAITENPEEKPSEFLLDIRAELDEIKEEESRHPVRPHEKSELVKVKCRFRRKSVIKKPLFVAGLILLVLGGLLLGMGVALITGCLEEISVLLLTLSAGIAVILYIAFIALGAILAIVGAVLYAISLKNKRTEFVMETVSLVPDYNGKRLDKDTFRALKEREIKRTKNSL